MAIGIGSVLSLAFMAHHPTVGASGLEERVAEMSSKATLSGIVHGSLIALMMVVLFGLVELSATLGWHLARVRIGLMAHGLGAIAMSGAALVSGFVTSRLAAVYEGAPATELQALAPVLDLCWQINQALAQFGSWAFSAAVIAWSLVLIAHDRAARRIGVAGLVIGAFPVVGLATGHLRLHLHGMGAVMVALTLWYVAVAWWLWRRGRGSRPTEAALEEVT